MKADPVDEVALDLRAWREKVLNDLLIALTLSAIPVMALVFVEAVRHPEQWPAALAFLGMYGLVPALAALRRLDLRWRVWALLLVGHGVAALAMARGGLAGDGRIYLVVLPGIASILLGAQGALVSTAISLLTYALFAGLANLGLLSHWLVRHDNPLGASEWLFAGVTFAFALSVLLTLQWEFNRFQAETARRQAKLLETARVSHARYQIVSELVSDFAYALQVRPDGGLIPEWISGAFTRITGFHTDELLYSEDWVSILYPDDRDVARGSLQRLLSGQPHTAEFRIIVKSGEVRWLRNYARPVWSEEEQRVVRIYGAAQDITAQKEAERELEQSERRFRTFSETNLAGVYVMQDGVVRYINPALCRMLGYERDEVVGRLGIDELIHPDDRARIREQYRLRLGKEPKGTRYTLKALGKDGSTVYCDVLAHQIEYEGRPAILGTVLDVTERILTMQRLEEQVARLTLLKEVARGISALTDLPTTLERAVTLVQRTFQYEHVAIFTVDPEEGALIMQAKAGEFAHIFPEAHRLPLGKGMVGWVGLHGETLLANDVKKEPRYVESFPGMIPTRSELTVPIRIGGKVVGVLDVQSRYIDAFDEDDVMTLETVAHQVAVAMQNARLYDTLQQELAERQRLVAALQESEETARALLNALTESAVLIDGEGTVLAANEVAARSFGEGAERIVGRRLFDLIRDALPADVVRAREARIWEAARLARAICFEDRVDGRTFDHGVYPVVDERGEVTRLAILSRDVTERREMERRVAQAERLAALGRLAASLAHEINNPLQAIRSHLELALDFPLGPQERREHLSVVREEIERLTVIAQRVLSFARPSSGRREVVSIAQLVQRTLALTSKQMERSGVQVHLDLPADLPPLRVTPEQIVQVLLNLFINAVEAMPDGGHLGITARVDGDAVALAVTNDGPPIPAEHLERIFEPFFTTKPNSTGMGLAVSYGIVRQHGGDIRVENLEGGRGVRFVVTLPVAVE